jgi:hypothetical protein
MVKSPVLPLVDVTVKVAEPLPVTTFEVGEIVRLLFGLEVAMV